MYVKAKCMIEISRFFELLVWIKHVWKKVLYCSHHQMIFSAIFKKCFCENPKITPKMHNHEKVVFLKGPKKLLWSRIWEILFFRSSSMIATSSKIAVISVILAAFTTVQNLNMFPYERRTPYYFTIRTCDRHFLCTRASDTSQHTWVLYDIRGAITRDSRAANMYLHEAEIQGAWHARNTWHA